MLLFFSNHKDRDDRVAVPQLQGCDHNMCLHFPITKGSVVIREDELRLGENTRGVSNTPYLVEFKANLRTEVLDSRQEPILIEPFLINIMFCDDTERQQQLNEIQTNLSFYRNQRQDIEKELENKRKKFRDQDRKYIKVREREKTLHNKLYALNEKCDLSDAQKIENKIKEYEQKANAKQHTFRGQPIDSTHRQM